MKKRNGKFNDKRRMINWKECDFQYLSNIASQAKYGGNPEHKMNPGDFNLTPPRSPRAGKSLCDSVNVFTTKEALALLRKGIRIGLVSDRPEGDWPKNVWSVMDDGTPVEAQIESSEQGSYHGYPMQETDPFCQKVIEQWRIRSEKANS